MLFSSMIFIWVFLPIVIIINYLFNLIIRNKKIRIHAKNVFLLIASLVFYAWGSPYFLCIMLSSILLNYVCGLILSKISERNSALKTFVLAIAIILNLSILIYFKYFNMIMVVVEQFFANHTNTASLIEDIAGMKRTGMIPISNIVLPIGISFFTFQAMSYVIDVYRGNARPQKNILDFGLYVALFPQLIAGPIVRYEDVANQINSREENFDRFSYGVKKFCYGLGKKVIIANTLADIVDSIWAYDLSKLGLVVAWIGIVFYTLQIYYDFSGYSDMAIGLGRMFGFEFKENFNYPYTSSSIVEFWRRWHISLTSWFREYVYFPLGGSRCGKFRTNLNIFIVFFLTGIWHGANWTFIIWGILFAIIQILERFLFLKNIKENKFSLIHWFFTMTIVTVLFVIFRANNIYDAVVYLKQLITLDTKYSIFSFLSMKVIAVFIFAVLFMGIVQRLFSNIYKKISNSFFVCSIDFVLQILIFAYSVLSIVSGTYNPFIYFQF